MAVVGASKHLNDYHWWALFRICATNLPWKLPPFQVYSLNLKFVGHALG